MRVKLLIPALKKMKTNIIGNFYRPSIFYSLFNEKRGNSKEISFFYEFEWLYSQLDGDSVKKVEKIYPGLLSAYCC